MASIGSNDDYVVHPGSLRSQAHRQPDLVPGSGLAEVDEGFARFLKEHSSPTHHRVTAAGRVIPFEKNPPPPEFKLEINNQTHAGINPSTRNFNESELLEKRHFPTGNYMADSATRMSASSMNINVGGRSAEGYASNFQAGHVPGFEYPLYQLPHATYGNFGLQGYGLGLSSLSEPLPQLNLTTSQATEQAQAQNQAQAPHAGTSSRFTAPLVAPVPLRPNLGQFNLASSQHLAAQYAASLTPYPLLNPHFDPRGQVYSGDYQLAYPNVLHLNPGVQSHTPTGHAVQPTPVGTMGVYNQTMSPFQAPNGAVYYSPMLVPAQLRTNEYLSAAATNESVPSNTPSSNEASQESFDSAKREFDHLSESLVNLDRHLAVNGPKIDSALKVTFRDQRMDIVVRRADAKQHMDRMEALLKMGSHSHTTVVGSFANCAIPIRPPHDEASPSRPSYRLNVEAPVWTPEAEARNSREFSSQASQEMPLSHITPTQENLGSNDIVCPTDDSTNLARHKSMEAILIRMKNGFKPVSPLRGRISTPFSSSC